MWCGIWDDTILGPYFIEGNLNGETYLNLLNTELWPDLEPIIDANADINPIFMQDGCPAHNSRIVRPWLFQHFDQNWIGTNGPIHWPPRSPDLTMMDFFLWGYVKNRSYPAQNMQALRNNIIQSVRSIDKQMLKNVQNLWVEKINKCFAANGRHFEHL